MVQVRCPSCGKNLKVPDAYAGKKAKCPGCQETLTIPEAPVEGTPAAPASSRQAPPPIPDEDSQEAISVEVKPSRRSRDDDYDDRPRRRPRDDDDRPRRRSLARGEWADCPSCGANEATRVHWTFWGGMIGPAIINTVRCGRCSSSYNGVHGDYNTTRVAIYLVVSIVLGLILAGVLIVFQTLK